MCPEGNSRRLWGYFGVIRGNSDGCGVIRLPLVWKRAYANVYSIICLVAFSVCFITYVGHVEKDTSQGRLI